MRVAVRPALKAVRIETADSEQQSAGVVTGSAGGGSGSALTQGDDRVVDSFLAMEDTRAHYRINTYANSGTVELVDLSNQQVLAVFSPGRELNTRAETANALLLGTLRAIGFPVTEPAATGATSIPRPPPLATPSQPSPILTVVPSSDWLWEAAYALSIERRLIQLGLHVVRPPAPHYREQSAALAKGATNILPGDFLSKATSARKVESFWVFEETAAGVVLETSSYSNTVKVIDKASKEVRSVVTVYAGGVIDSASADSLATLRNALIAAGVAVAEPVKRPAPTPKRRSKVQGKT
jgi:hypothetical protein